MKSDKTSILNKNRPSGRVLTMDMIRGIAIIFMTIFHQWLIYRPDGIVGAISIFLGYLAAPLFLSVSGMVVLFHEKKYRWPFKMVVHGLVLFSMAWSIDILYHQTFKISWDIFQLIGAAYIILGFSNYLGHGSKKYLSLSLLIIAWIFAPSIRPDQGVFPIWPFGAFFLGGYIFIHFAISRFNNFLNTVTLLSIIVAYTIYWAFIGKMPQIASLYGILFALGVVFLLTIVGFWVEEIVTLQDVPFSFLIRFGTYPLSLYMGQQIVTRMGLNYHLYMKVTNIPLYDWMIQTVILLTFMYLTTFIMDRVKFFGMEWWLRQIESKILKGMPQKVIFSAKLPPMRL